MRDILPDPSHFLAYNLDFWPENLLFTYSSHLGRSHQFNKQSHKKLDVFAPNIKLERMIVGDEYLTKLMYGCQ